MDFVARKSAWPRPYFLIASKRSPNNFTFLALSIYPHPKRKLFSPRLRTCPGPRLFSRFNELAFLVRHSIFSPVGAFHPDRGSGRCRTFIGGRSRRWFQTHRFLHLIKGRLDRKSVV